MKETAYNIALVCGCVLIIFLTALIMFILIAFTIDEINKRMKLTIHDILVRKGWIASPSKPHIVTEDDIKRAFYNGCEQGKALKEACGWCDSEIKGDEDNTSTPSRRMTTESYEAFKESLEDMRGWRDKHSEGDE